ncbi:MAG: hypothetical protein AB2392_02010 [Neobacillus sp.]
MYRFSIEEEEWILRFSPQVLIGADEQQAILMSLLQIGKGLSVYSHGDAFLIFTEQIGAIVFNVERIPSFILTVSNIIPESSWYEQRSSKD